MTSADNRPAPGIQTVTTHAPVEPANSTAVGRRASGKTGKTGKNPAKKPTKKAAQKIVVSKKRAPTRALEREMWDRGHDVVVGIDEVGRGAWAGPLMVGAAVLPRDTRVNGVRDSKLLSEREREALFDRIADWCVSWSVGAASQQECDQLGMSAAQKLAARRAIEGLSLVPDVAVTDGRWDFVSPSVAHVELAVKADLRCLSVAAASILAKVVRDREMRRHAVDYPNWSFDTNKGYPCPVHKSALVGYGPSTIHRRTWVFMDHYVPWTAIKRTPPAGQTSLF